MSAKWDIRYWALAALSLGSFSCTHSEPNFVYMPDMMFSPALKAQSVGVMKAPVKGTIPRDYQPYAYANATDEQLRRLKNPLRPTMDVVTRGQAVFNIYCIACHGPAGEGDGTVVPRFPRPPSLQSDKIRSWADAQIYHIVTQGRNLMPSYASQISPGDRWALIYYVRALQKSKHPTPEEVKTANQESR